MLKSTLFWILCVVSASRDHSSWLMIRYQKVCCGSALDPLWIHSGLLWHFRDVCDKQILFLSLWVGVKVKEVKMYMYKVHGIHICDIIIPEWKWNIISGPVDLLGPVSSCMLTYMISYMQMNPRFSLYSGWLVENRTCPFLAWVMFWITEIPPNFFPLKTVEVFFFFLLFALISVKYQSSGWQENWVRTLDVFEVSSEVFRGNKVKQQSGCKGEVRIK